MGFLSNGQVAAGTEARLTHERASTLKRLVVYSSSGPETQQVNEGARRKYQIFKNEQNS